MLTKNLVLMGGGHSHAIALKLWGMNRLPNVRLTLISNVSHTPYSGMLPAYVAGFYTFDETHIDLRRLTEFAHVQFYHDEAIGLDLENNRVICAKHPPVAFDYLSIDIGSTPATSTVLGASNYAIPAKPVPHFLKAWDHILNKVEKLSDRPLSITIVGGGAGGVELALNMQSHLYKILKNPDLLTLHLFQRGNTLLPYHNTWVSKRLEHLLIKRNIQLHLGETVSQITPNQEQYTVKCESRLSVQSDHIFWVTQADSPAWIKQSKLALDTRGFILVNHTLQSCSHPYIFATGDIATIENDPRPKAGVFAVRQGKPLFENLQRIIQDKPLKNYFPQKQYLSLIGTGDKSAIASWWKLGFHSPLLWTWKDYIDCKFMQNFEDLPLMDSEERSDNTKSSLDKTATMLCAGCGSKVGHSVLDQVFNRLNIEKSSDTLIGLDTPDDAAVVRVSANHLRVYTLDFFRSLINDPFIFGQIVTHHCLSDIFAMGATPKTALAMVTLPYAKDKISEEILYQLLSGSLKALHISQTDLIGGHTTQGEDLSFGLSCQGIIYPDKILTKKGMKSEQVLILTKALGIGTLFAANMRYQAKGRWIDNAIDSMLLSNQIATEIFLQNGATACTDITGFGLLGHLIEMMLASSVSVQLNLASIPILDGAIAAVEQGFFSSLHPSNLQFSRYVINAPNFQTSPLYSLLFDPQTSGGLLASIPLKNANTCLQQLQQAGYLSSRIIGHVKNDTKPVSVEMMNDE